MKIFLATANIPNFSFVWQTLICGNFELELTHKVIPKGFKVDRKTHWSLKSLYCQHSKSFWNTSWHAEKIWENLIKIVKTANEIGEIGRKIALIPIWELSSQGE